MNKLMFVICAMTVSNLNAQLISGGLFRNQILTSNQNNISSQGIDLSSTHYFFSVNMGAGMGGNKNTQIQNKYIGAEFTPTGFHHAYIANKFAPFIGFQISKNKLTESSNLNTEFNSTIDRNTIYNLSLGVKYSYNRMIFSGAYLMGKQEKSIGIKVAYVFAVTHKCLKKHLVPLELGF